MKNHIWVIEKFEHGQWRGRGECFILFDSARRKTNKLNNFAIRFDTGDIYRVVKLRECKGVK
jgi:hypothetical protein